MLLSKPLQADPHAHLVEHRLDSQVQLEGSFLTVCLDRVRLPDGSEATRQYIRHPGAVAVVPLLDDGRILLVRQYRYPVQQIMVELPAGKIDAGEAPLDCARRELLEETGHRAGEWARAGRFRNAAAYSTEAMEIWFARGLVPGPQRLDAGEFVELCPATMAEFEAMARAGEVGDMKTMIGLQWLMNWRAGHWPLQWHADAVA
jgi:ADP-ribose pyrophosphatase